MVLADLVDQTTSSIGREITIGQLADLYAASTTGPWLRVNMISTLDGAAAGADGLSGSINNAADKLVFDLLRTLADLVLVGAGTIRAEGYSRVQVSPKEQRRRRGAGRSANPATGVVSRTGELPERVLAAQAETELHVLVPTDCARLSALRERLGPDRVHPWGVGSVDLPAALASLRTRGFAHILSEGGPSLLGDLLRADLVDELDLTWSPSCVGGDQRRIVTGPLTAPIGWRPAVLVEQDGTVIGRWLRH